MNRLPAKIKRFLQQQSPCDLIQTFITSGKSQWKMDIDALTAIERRLFNHDILSLAVEDNSTDRPLVRFTSGLIYRICIDCVFPRRNIRLDAILPPLQLLETAFRHMSPSQLRIKMSSNLSGPAEHMF